MNIKTLTFLTLSSITGKISTYFWHKHVQELRKQQYKQGLRP